MIRILIVDDQTIIRQGLKSLLESKPDLEVVGEAENGQMAIEQATLLRPDIVLMDIRMPVMDGVAATQVICQTFPEMNVLVLTTFDDEEYISQSMRFGARGYLLKDTHSDELASAIRAAHKGFTQMGPGIFEKAFVNPSVPALPPPSLPNIFAELTPREREILQLVAHGSNNKEIAVTLHLSESTVKNYMTSILSRLNLRDRTQAAILAHSFYFNRTEPL